MNPTIISFSQLQSKKILILGYGKEGRSAESFLKRRFPDNIILTADQTDGPGYLNKQDDADVVIKTPGISKSYVKKPYTTATNLFFELCKGRIIGVTGSKGKSTTAALIYHLLKAEGLPVHLVGNIGVSALDELDKSNTQDDIFVFELSSYQLDDITKSPHVAVVTSLFPEHMDYHGSLDGYYQAKQHIITYQTPHDYYLYNDGFSLLAEWVKTGKGKPVPFARQLPLPRNRIHLIGEHNEANMRGAVTAARLFDVSDSTIIAALQTFQPLRHRLEKVGVYKEITFYDDAISTTPESTLAALESIHNISTLFLGGSDRGYDFSRLMDQISRSSVETLVLFPVTGPVMKRYLKNHANKTYNILETRDMEEAVAYAYKHAKKGTACLLSTASPSYSVWRNFEEKGDLFKKYVNAYGKK